MVVVAADAEAAAAHTGGGDPRRRRARLVVTEPSGAERLVRLGLRRRDRIEWVPGWHQGHRGAALARAVEAVGQAGGFGRARHRFRAPG